MVIDKGKLVCMCQHLYDNGAALEDDEHPGIVAAVAAAPVAAHQARPGGLGYWN